MLSLSKVGKATSCLFFCLASFICLTFGTKVFANNSKESSKHEYPKEIISDGVAEPNAKYEGDFLIDDQGKLWDYKGTSADVKIPDNVKIVGLYALSNHCEIKSVKIPEGVVSISNYAFSGCTRLEEIIIPDHVSNIGMLAFSGCTGLKRVYIGKNVEYIGQMCFWLCDSLKKIEVSVDNEHFSSCKGVLYDKNFDVLIKCPQGFEGKFVAYKKVKKICDYAFDGCYKLDKIIFKDSVENIGKAAFFNCVSLVRVYIGKDVVSIGSCAFANCVLLNEINLPDTIKEIDSSAFYYCRSLVKFTVTSKDVKFGDNIFKRCSPELSIYGYENSAVCDYAKKEKINFIGIK